MYKVIMEESLKFFGKSGGGMQGLYGAILDMDFGVAKAPEVQRDEYVIVMSTHLRDGLTPEEFEAIRLHEVGHFVNNHEARAITAGALKESPTSNAVLINQSFEMEADAYAAERVGGKVMANALRRIPALMISHPGLVDCVRQKFKLSEAELTARLIDGHRQAIESIQYRLDALE